MPPVKLPTPDPDFLPCTAEDLCAQSDAARALLAALNGAALRRCLVAEGKEALLTAYALAKQASRATHDSAAYAASDLLRKFV